MDSALLLEQLLNGLQYGVMLFLMAAGLTLVFGIMNFINLAHGSFYMLGAFFAATLVQWTGSFLLGILLATIACVAVGALVEVLIFRRLYERDHLDQVLGTFSLILFFNEMVSIVWGTEPVFMNAPPWLSGSVELMDGIPYPVLRLVITGCGLALGLLLYLLITRTRLGMLIRAGASDRKMVQGLGVNISAVFTATFALGVALAGFAGMITGPLLTVQIGMGEPMLIVAFVVVVIGGIGSVRGAFIAALLVGLADTLGRSFLPVLLGPSLGATLASMVIYIFMAGVLLLKPQGLFQGRG